MATIDDGDGSGLEPAKLSGPALRTFFNIADAWNLSETEQMKILGCPEVATLQSWRNGDVETLDKDTLERISYVLGIYKGIHTIIAQNDRADGWMRRPNKAPEFGGRSAIERLTNGSISDLQIVRQYIDAQCG